MKRKNLSLVLLFLFISAYSLVMRFVPHPANFVPIGALSLLTGMYLKNKWAIVMPVALMAVSDFIIGWHNLVLFTWLGFLAFGFLGWWAGNNRGIRRLLGASISGSVFFYLLTNAAVWAFTPLYPKTLVGLIRSYYLALPFFRNSIFGDVFYSLLFFGLFELILNWAVIKKKIYSLARHQF